MNYELNRSLTVQADRDVITGFRRARLTGHDALGLYPMPFVLWLWNLEDTDYLLLCSAKALSVRSGDSMLASGSVSDSVQVEIRDGDYLFGPPEMPATAMTQRITEAEWLPPVGMNVEPYFRTTVYEDDVSPAFLMMVLSFPALRFY